MKSEKLTGTPVYHIVFVIPMFVQIPSRANPANKEKFESGGAIRVGYPTSFRRVTGIPSGTQFFVRCLWVTYRDTMLIHVVSWTSGVLDFGTLERLMCIWVVSKYVRQNDLDAVFSRLEQCSHAYWALFC